MPIPQHRNSRQRLSAIFPLPITPNNKRAVRISLAAHTHTSCVGLQDPWLEMGFDGPGVQSFLEGFEGWEFLPEMQGRHIDIVSGADGDGR